MMRKLNLYSPEAALCDGTVIDLWAWNGLFPEAVRVFIRAN
jgi:hypothetical protein